MKPEDFALLSDLLKERSGLVLSPDKDYLLESWLLPVARKRGMETLDDLVGALRLRKEEVLIRDITEAMTTNESFFFRDIKPFDRFRDVVVPSLMESRATAKRIRIWCAACSSGQEPYSLAMVIKENPALAGWRIEIIATDISREILEKARAGVYSQFEVQRGLPIQMLVKYFKQNGEMWQIDAGIRGMVQYREINLMDNFSGLGAFDVVFCRNVLIYFDRALKTDVLNRVGRQMPNDGFLFLGGAETVIGMDTPFEPMKGERGLYQIADQRPN